MARTPLALDFSGSKLRVLRHRRGWRQEDLSDRTADSGPRRVSRESISRFETGDATPSPTAFGALVRALGCEPDDLLVTESAA